MRSSKTKVKMKVLVGLAAAVALAVGCSEQRSPGRSPAGNAEQNPAAVAEAAGTSKQAIAQEEINVKIKVNSPDYKRFFELGQPGAIIPGLNQGLVPQGFAYYPDKNWMLVASYRKEEGVPSVLSVVDLSTGKLLKSLNLYTDEGTPYSGHSGGVAVSASHVWLSSEKQLYKMSLDDLVKGADGGKLIFTDKIRTETNASFCTYADGVLWVGEFARFDFKTSETHHLKNRKDQEQSAWVVGYKLSSADTIEMSGVTDAARPAVPQYVLSVQDQIQGMAVSDNHVFLSESYGRDNESVLHVYRFSPDEPPHAHVKLGADAVPLWLMDPVNEQVKLQMPPMSEGIFDRDGVLYILFESGAEVYRNGLYPLDRVYQLDRQKLLQKDQ